jgi:hypothetical protein
MPRFGAQNDLAAAIAATDDPTLRAEAARAEVVRGRTI